MADVGWNIWEEIDLVPAAGGRSYGWPCYEASTHTPGYRNLSECQAEYAKEGTPTANVLPAYEYDDSVGAAVLAGPTYTGNQYPASYRNSIFFGDYTGNFVKRLVLDSQGRVSSVEPFTTDWIGTDIEQHPANGDLIFANYGTGAPGDGTIRRVVY